MSTTWKRGQESWFTSLQAWPDVSPNAGYKGLASKFFVARDNGHGTIPALQVQCRCQDYHVAGVFPYVGKLVDDCKSEVFHQNIFGFDRRCYRVERDGSRRFLRATSHTSTSAMVGTASRLPCPGESIICFAAWDSEELPDTYLIRALASKR